MPRKVPLQAYKSFGRGTPAIDCECEKLSKSHDKKTEYIEGTCNCERRGKPIGKHYIVLRGRK